MKNLFEITNHERNAAMKRFLLLCIPLLILFFTACQEPTPPTPPASKPTINSFTATPPSLPAGGGSVTLSWNVEGATTLEIDGGVGAVTGTSKTVSVTSNKTFTLTATNDAGSTTQTTSVSVGAGADTTPPSVISIDPPDGAKGVKFDSTIVITFSEKMDQVATQNAFLPTERLTTYEFDFSWNAEGTVLTIDPKGDLIYARGADVNTLQARTYGFTLEAAAKDSAGNALESVSSSFATLRRVQTRLPAIPALMGTGYSNNVSVDAGFPARVGDSGVSGSQDVAARAFFTFDLSSIPNSVKDVDIDFAEVVIHKMSVSGNPYALGSINLDHVNFGSTAAQTIFYTPTLQNLGIFDDATKAQDSYHGKDATNAFRDDLNNRAARGNRSQYRLAFLGSSVSQNGVMDFVFFFFAGDSSRDAYLSVSYLIT